MKGEYHIFCTFIAGKRVHFNVKQCNKGGGLFGGL